MAIHPEALPGLEAELSWFKIDYTDRVTRPMLTGIALSTPVYAEFITYAPTLEQQAEILAIPNFVNVTGAPYDPDRSEEHASELQPLMGISYAVFCLKKKKKF